MTDTNDMLETLFREARASAPPPGDDFLARVLADAEAVQSGRDMAGRAAPMRGRRTLLSRLSAALGGAIMVAGVGSAAMAGLVIGYVQPEPVVDLAGSMGLASGESLELLPAFDLLLSEDAAE